MEQVEEIESDHRSLCRKYIVNECVKTKIDQHDHETMFNISWDDVQGCVSDDSFRCLQQFCCGLVTVFSNTTSVDSDFFILKWEKDDQRTDLTYLALEGGIPGETV